MQGLVKRVIDFLYKKEIPTTGYILEYEEKTVNGYNKISKLQIANEKKICRITHDDSRFVHKTKK